LLEDRIPGLEELTLIATGEVANAAHEPDVTTAL
jgi:hypothetical protein